MTFTPLTTLVAIDALFRVVSLPRAVGGVRVSYITATLIGTGTLKT
ncbi:MAG: hypothetical protein WKF30_10715 [Pyrinomonadaceae bacterium]